MKKVLLSYVTALVSLLACASSQATILTFEITGITNNIPIPQEYGDRVTSLSEVSGALTFNYGQGNGFTPDVVVEYTGTAASTPSSWTVGYGDLTDIIWGQGPSFGVNYVTISLIADAGYDVVLNSFDIAAWVGDRPTEKLEISVDGASVDLNTTILGDDSHSTINPGATGSRIDITYGNAWWFGLDNLNFDQRLDSSSSVPEPTTLLLLSLGLAGLGLAKRRQILA